MYYKYMMVAILLLLLGVLGIVLNSGHLMMMLMSMELMLLAASFLFLINSMVMDILIEQIFTIMILTVAAAESAIGLAILVTYYRMSGTMAIKSLNWLKG